MALEEADHRRVLAERREVVRELRAEIGLGAGVGCDRCRAQDKRAHAHEQGLSEHDLPVVNGARRSRANPRSGPCAAVRVNAIERG